MKQSILILIALLLVFSCKKDKNIDKDSGTLNAVLESGTKVLWIGAHPDDETVISGILFAKCIEHGGEIKMISLTAGKYGSCCPESIANGTCPTCIESDTCEEYLGIQREHEFMTAASHFKAEGEVWWWDDFLTEDNYDTLISYIQQEIITYKPEVLITHAPKGGYGHHEHVICSKIVTDAFENLSVETQPEYFFYALHRYPDPPSVDTESATEIIDGSVYSSVFKKTYWEVMLEGLSLFSTQCDIYQKGLEASDYLQNNYYYHVGSE